MLILNQNFSQFTIHISNRISVIIYFLFDKAFIERGSEDKYKEGLYMFRLLKQKNGQPVGKIYCAHNGYDRALAASTSVGLNWVTPMGTVGVVHIRSLVVGLG